MTGKLGNPGRGTGGLIIASLSLAYAIALPKWRCKTTESLPTRIQYSTYLASVTILFSFRNSTVRSSAASVLNVLEETCLTDKDRVKADLEDVDITRHVDLQIVGM